MALLCQIQTTCGEIASVTWKLIFIFQKFELSDIFMQHLLIAFFYRKIQWCSMALDAMA